MSKVTVLQTTNETWQHGGTVAYLRISSNKRFVPLGGEIVQKSSLARKQWYAIIECEVVGETIIIPQFQIDATSDASPGTARFTASFYDARGRKLGDFLKNFRVPDAPATTDWETLFIYNLGNVTALPDEYLTAAETLALLASATVTFARLPNVSKKTLLGNKKDETGEVESIELGTNLTFGVDGKLNASGGGIIGSFAENALPTTNLKTGDRALRTDKMRGEMRWTGTKWIPVDGKNRVNLLDFCHPAVVTDCSAGIQAAVDFLKNKGGTILLPDDYTFAFSNTINLQNAANVGFEASRPSLNGTATLNLLFTGGADKSRAFDLRQSFGFSMKNVTMNYNNPEFTGNLLRWGFGTGNNPAASVRMLIEGCRFSGTPAAHNAQSFLNLGGCLIGAIRDCGFHYAKQGIRGREKNDVAEGGFLESYIIDIVNNTFNELEECIFNIGCNYNIDQNTFEPQSLDVYETNKLVAVDSESGMPISRAIRFTGNWLGDATNASQPMARFVRCNGLKIANNWQTVSAIGTHYELVGCSGVGIEYNRFESFDPVGSQVYNTGGVLMSNATEMNYNVRIAHNIFNVLNPVTNTGAPTIGYVQEFNEQGGALLKNYRNTGQTIVGSNATDAPHTDTKGITLGNITGNVTTVTTAEATIAPIKYGAAIRTCNATGDYGDGSMLLSVRGEAFAQFIFWNGGEILVMDAQSIRPNKHFRFKTDNTFDFGNSGANRPRTGYFGTSVVTPSLNLNGQVLDNLTVALKSEVAASAATKADKAADVRTATGTTDTLVVADLGKDVRYTNVAAKVVTLPPTAGFNANFVCAITNLEAGALTFAAGAGVTIRNNTGALAQWKTATLRILGTDQWIITGEMA